MNHSNNSLNQQGKNGKSELDGWIIHQPGLIEFVRRVAIRKDCYGTYYKKNGQTETTTAKEPITPQVLSRHFIGEKQIGIHVIKPEDNTSKVGVADIDLHDEPKAHKGEMQPPADPKDNLLFAKSLFEKCLTLKIKPLLIDSNGKGGYHLWVVFDCLLPAATIRRFFLWLTQHHQDYNVSRPEIFPKQDTISETGYGNWIRLPGKHHTRDHYSKVWDGSAWLAGAEAAKFISDYKPQDYKLIPPEALDYNPPSPPPKPPKPVNWSGEYNSERWWENYTGNLKTLDIASLFDEDGLLLGSNSEGWIKVLCPWRDHHTTGQEWASVMDKRSEDMFPVFNCFHAHCEDKTIEDVLAYFGKEKVDSCCSQQIKKEVCLEDKVDQIIKPVEIVRQGVDDLCAIGEEERLRAKPKPEEYRKGYTLPELDALPAPSFLIDQHITCGAFGCLYGVSGAAKSFVSLNMSYCVATGIPFMDRFKVKQGPVAYICAEGGRGIKKRAHGWLNHYKITEQVPIIFVPAPFNFLAEDEAKTALEIINRDLKAKPVLIIVDTLSRCMNGNERLSEDMMAYVRNIDYLIRETGAATISVHHSGWNIERERGATNLRDSCDVMIQLLPENPSNVTQNELTTIICTKQKDDEPFEDYIIKKKLIGTVHGTTCVWNYFGTVAEKKNLDKETKEEEDAMTMLQKEQEFLSHVPFGKENAIDSTTHRDEKLKWKKSYHNNVFNRLKQKGGSFHYEVKGGSNPSLYWRDVE